jgi:hypothetical protein
MGGVAAAPGDPTRAAIDEAMNLWLDQDYAAPQFFWPDASSPAPVSPSVSARFRDEVVIGRDSSPFVDVPRAEARDARWVEPVLVAEVEFTAWTPNGHLRHPSFKGLREDKSAREVTAEGAPWP